MKELTLNILKIMPNENSEETIKYKIFYQSLEYPNSFAKNLAKQFTESAELTFTNGNVSANKGKKTTDYHNNVRILLSKYFNTLGSHIVILGEYMDQRYPDNNDQGSYIIAGTVGNGRNDDGTRAMTVYYRKNMDLEGVRITALDGSTQPIPKNIDQVFINIRNVDKHESDGRLLELSKIAKGTLGQCIEVMIYNRYMIFAHVLGLDEKAKSNAKEALSSYTEKINQDDAKKYIIAGDLNYKCTHGQHNINIHTNPTDRPQFNANTDALILPENNASDSRAQRQMNIDENKAQRQMNTAGKSCSNKIIICRDGMYSPDTEDGRTKYEMEGSLWPIVLINTQWQILSDHKGFMMNVEIAHESVDSPTLPFTPRNHLEALQDGTQEPLHYNNTDEVMTMMMSALSINVQTDDYIVDWSGSYISTQGPLHYNNTDVAHNNTDVAHNNTEEVMIMMMSALSVTTDDYIVDWSGSYMG